MNRPQQGIDRITSLRVNAQVITTQKAFKRHKQLCADCARADNIASKFCDEGWTLVKAAHKAINAQRDYQRSTLPPAPGEQGTLW